MLNDRQVEEKKKEKKSYFKSNVQQKNKMEEHGHTFLKSSFLFSSAWPYEEKQAFKTPKRMH